MGKSKKHDKKPSKKKHKHKSHKSKKKCKKDRKEMKYNKDETKEIPKKKLQDDQKQESFAIPLELMNNKSHAPETPEEYERRQKHIRRVTDPVTGRVRLIKGDNEVLEEIVSKERHADINKKATQGDGRYFEERTLGARATKQRRN